MAAVQVTVFDCAEGFSLPVPGVRSELTVLDSGPFMAKVTGLELDQLWVRRLTESGARVMEANFELPRIAVAFQTHPGSEMLWNGAQVEANSLAVMQPGRLYHQRFSGPSHWGAVSLPVGTAASLLGTIIGGEPNLFRRCRPVRTSQERIGTLRMLHASAGHLAEHAPEIIRNVEAARGLEQALIMALANCLSGESDDGGDATGRRHNIVIARLRDFLQINSDRALHVPEVCQQIGVSERALRICCHEYFGVGPRRYLMLRRMHLAYRGLRAADPDSTSVTEIATQFCFWELGRFAVEYRKIFGKSPSDTLRQPAPGISRRLQEPRAGAEGSRA
jgi:AraC-like DNA-binding protein